MADDINQPSPQDGPKDQPGDKPQPRPAKRRRGRRWLKVIGALVVLLLALLALAPALLGTGPGKSLVLKIINGSLNGRAELADLSLSWNGGASVSGLKIYDDKNEPVISVARLKTQLSLWKTITGGFARYDLGRTEVDGLDLTKVHIDEQGNLNLARLLKPTEKKESKPLQLSADLRINQMTGTVTKAGLAQTLRIKPSDIALTIKDLNQPIDNNINLAFAVEDSANPQQATPGSISIAGTADLLENDRFDLAKLAVKETIKLTAVNVAAINPFLTGLKIAGLANGQVDVNIQGAGNARAVGQINVAGFEATGDKLNGDVLKSQIAIPINITRVTENQDLNVLKIEQLKIQTDYGYVSVSLDASQESLQRLAKNQAPGREGHITLTLHFPEAQKLLNDLPRTLKLAEGVKVTSAELYTQSDIWLKHEFPVTKHHVSIPKVAGTRTTKDESGKEQTRQIALQAIDMTLDFSYLPAPGGAVPTGQLRDIAITLDSNFAHLEGNTGKDGTLAQFTLAGNGDLGRLREQLAQFVDLGNVKLDGKWTLAADTNGDPSKEDAPVQARLKFNLTNAAIEGLGTLPKISQPWLAVSAGGTLKMVKNAPEAITAGYLTLKSNNETDPTVDLSAKLNLNLKTLESDYFELEKLVVKLDKARDEFGAMIRALDYFADGQITASMKGAYDGKVLAIAPDKPLVVKGTRLALRRPATQNAPAAVVAKDHSLDVTFAGDVQLSPSALGADIKTLSAVSGKLLDVHNDQPIKLALERKSGAWSGNGSLAVFADFKQLGDLAKAFSPPAEEEPAKDPNQLTRGLLKGSMSFARGDKPGTTLSANFTADVAVTTSKEPLAEQIPITLVATLPDQLTQPLSATIDVKSKLLNATLSDAVVVLMEQMADKTIKTNSPLEMFRGAKLVINAPHLPALQALAANFSAPKAAPAPTQTKKVTGEDKITIDSDEAAIEAARGPIRILDGGLAFDATLAREGTSTLLKDARLQIERLKIERGDGFYEAQDRKIDVKLAAAVETAPQTGEPRKITLSALEGNLDVGQVKLLSPIVISDWNGALKASGGIELAGTLEHALQLLEAIQGAKPFSKYHYSGAYTLKQEISTKGNALRPAGTVEVAKFKAFDPQAPRKVTFAEDLLVIRNDIDADLASDTLTLNHFSIDMKSTGALMLTLSNGQLVDWTNARKIPGELRAKVKIDWPKLWAMVKPMLDPETVAGLGEFQIAGVMERDFVVTGSFPAKGVNRKGRTVDLFFQNSIRSLRATGGVSIERLLVKGMDIQRVEVPVTLEKGILEIRDSTRPKGQGIPQPISCNGGTIDIGGIGFDLTYVDPKNTSQIVPLMTIPGENRRLVNNVSINPALAESALGKYVNTAFSGSRNAGGIVNLTALYCEQLPLGVYMKDPKNPGKAKFSLTMSAVELKSDGLGNLTKAMGAAMAFAKIGAGGGGQFQSFDSVRGAIETSTVTIEGGRIKHDLKLQTDRLGEWAFNGNLTMANRSYSYLNVSVPTSLFPDPGGNLQKFFGRQITFPYAGSIESPEISKDFVAKFTQENFLKGLENLFQPGEKRDTPKPRGNEPINRDPRDKRSSNQPGNDPINDLANIAGSLLEPKKDKPRDPGDDRISSEPKKKKGK